MKLLTEKQKEEITFLDTAIKNYDRELTKLRGHIKQLIIEKQKYSDIRKRLLK